MFSSTLAFAPSIIRFRRMVGPRCGGGWALTFLASGELLQGLLFNILLIGVFVVRGLKPFKPIM
jgi:hypothetical protein